MCKKSKIILVIMVFATMLLSTACSQKSESSVITTSTIAQENETEKSTIETTIEKTTASSIEKTTESAAKKTVNEKTITLNNVYITKFGEVNLITYPKFTFNYPDNWKVVEEEVTQEGEIVTLKNNSGTEVKYSHFANLPEDHNFGTSTVSMARVEVSKAKNSQFVPSYVQATDYSNLGDFMVAKLKVTGMLDMQTDKDFTDVDGTVSYAVLPQTTVGTREDVRGAFEGEFTF